MIKSMLQERNIILFYDNYLIIIILYMKFEIMFFPKIILAAHFSSNTKKYERNK